MIKADYDLTIVTTAHDPEREALAGQLALYLISPAVQVLLTDYGFSSR